MLTTLLFLPNTQHFQKMGIHFLLPIPRVKIRRDKSREKLATRIRKAFWIWRKVVWRNIEWKKWRNLGEIYLLCWKKKIEAEWKREPFAWFISVFSVVNHLSGYMLNYDPAGVCTSAAQLMGKKRRLKWIRSASTKMGKSWNKCRLRICIWRFEMERMNYILIG